MENKIKNMFRELQETNALEDVSLEYILYSLNLEDDTEPIIDEIAESLGIQIQNKIYCSNNHLERVVGKNTSRLIDLLAYCNICDKSFVICNESIDKVYKLNQ